MAGNFWLGLAIIVGSGMLNASFPLPMKYSRTWKWENTWFLFTTLALFLIPLAMAAVAVPDLAGVYGSLPARAFLPGLIFGFLWGTAQVTFGIAIAGVGMAMAFAIVVGMSGLFGSLISMGVLHPADLAGPRGIALIVSAVILVIGLVIYGRAGRDRERETGAAGPSGANFRKGLIVCLYTGLMGGMINLGFAFSGAISETAVKFGSSGQRATLAVWLVVLAAGYIPNLVYTTYLMRRNGTAARFASAPGRETLLAAAVAVLWLGGTLGYGSGATAMGAYGTSIGYALYVTILLLWSTTLGVLTGEWKEASPATVRRMKVGVGVILVSVLVLSSTGFF
jgi:L-rhamnose-H+ transport protein